MQKGISKNINSYKTTERILGRQKDPDPNIHSYLHPLTTVTLVEYFIPKN